MQHIDAHCHQVPLFVLGVECLSPQVEFLKNVERSRMKPNYVAYVLIFYLSSF